MKKPHNRITVMSVLITAALSVIFAFVFFVSAGAQTQETETVGLPEAASSTGTADPSSITDMPGLMNPSAPTDTTKKTSPTDANGSSGINNTLETVILETFYIIDNNKCYYLIVRNGEKKYFEADLKNHAIVNPKEISKPNKEKTLPGENEIIGRPLSIDGYLKGYVALIKETQQSGSVAYIKKDFSQHMDLFDLNMQSGETTDLIYVSKDLRYFFYTQTNHTTTRLMAYDLAQNKSEQICENEIDKCYIVEQNAKDFSFYRAVIRADSDIPVLEPVDAQNRFYSDEGKKVKTAGYDTVILNGIVIDPETETIKFGRNIGIIGDKIAVITEQPITGRKKIDAKGLIISPGFIDMLGFNINSTAAKYKITDGVTTCLSMHGCTDDFSGFFYSYGKNPPLVNYGGALFEVKLRRAAGVGDYSKPTKKQIDAIVKRARQEIEDGAIAVAFSPEYYPGTSSEEIEAVMQVAREYNIPTHFHARYSALSGDHTGIDAVKEILGYAKKLNAAVHFMHLHSCGGTGCMDEALKMIDEARAQGYKVTYDIYPYDSWASRLNMARFRGDWQTRFGIGYADLQIPTKARGLTPEAFAQYRGRGALCIAYAIDDNEVIEALQEDYCMIGSDDAVYTEGGANSHPRASGTFARVIGRYSRDMDAFPLMDALRKMTINCAKHLEDIAPAMKVRGRLREGYVADITIFDYFSIKDRSTGISPAVASDGIPYVLVSGRVVLDKSGLHASAGSGKPIKGIFAK